MTSGFRAPDTRTFHSSPLICAECVRFDDPMYAVEKPEIGGTATLSHAVASC